CPAEDQVAAFVALLLGDDAACCLRKRDGVRPAVLRPLPGKGDHVAAGFRPAKAGDLAGTLPGQHEQLQDRAEVVIAERVPDQAKLGGGEHPIARLLIAAYRTYRRGAL